MKNIKLTEWLAFVTLIALFTGIIFMVVYIWSDNPVHVKVSATAIISFGCLLMTYSYVKWGGHEKP